MSPRPLLAIVLGGALLLGCHGLRAQEVQLTLVPDSSVTARPGSGNPAVDRGRAAVQANVSGTEDVTSCEAYGRQSAANGRASVTAEVLTSTTALAYRLDALAAANGGHYRTGTCAFNRRIGFTGHDTEASVDAQATAVIRIRFAGGRPNVPYFVKISRSQAGASQVDELIGPDGKAVALSNSGSPHPVIMSRPGQDYFLRTTVAVTARNKGGCCSEQREATSDMSVAVEAAPLLFGGHQTGYIVGGLQTQGHKNVAVVMLNGLPHCTATLISPGTLVTAAHCVNKHMTKERLVAGKVTVAFGSVYSEPLFAPIEVTRAVFPDSGTLVFDPLTLRHDIALLYLKSPVTFAGIEPAALHAGSPSWQSIHSNNSKLIFVGFGFNMLKNEKVGIGIKREAAWSISGYDDYAVSFSVPGLNTCNGDSGGPGFIEGSDALVLSAITSGGDDACTHGFDTRIDAYLAWLKPRMNQ